ncbi:alpha/beta hydrolase [Leptospira ilyithenensis]|uniref:Alpha/beta hydrolase n=2 Tax=Leptospira ilyithenensis TaxID=2484901 RepID=A0A4R9LSG0_9LEPT|nr:alpha/beta hydrolase [Leptospira ilyithenensis]
MKNMEGIPRYVDLGGHSLFFWDFQTDEKDCVVFLHGLLDHSFGFRRIIKDLLGDKKRIISFDHPGYGNSRLPKIKYLFQIDVWADLLLEALEKLNLQNVTLVGHSMGGLIAQHMVLADKSKCIKKLILLSPGGIPHPERERMQKLLFPKTENQVVELLSHLYGSDSPEPNFLLRKTLVTVWNGWENQFLQENTLKKEHHIFHGDKIRGIKIPTLIIAGENDEITPIAMMKKMKSYITGSKLVWLKGAKHAIHLERSSDIAREIKVFNKH